MKNWTTNHLFQVIWITTNKKPKNMTEKSMRIAHSVCVVVCFVRRTVLNCFYSMVGLKANFKSISLLNHLLRVYYTLSIIIKMFVTQTRLFSCNAEKQKSIVRFFCYIFISLVFLSFSHLWKVFFSLLPVFIVMKYFGENYCMRVVTPSGLHIRFWFFWFLSEPSTVNSCVVFSLVFDQREHLCTYFVVFVVVVGGGGVSHGFNL